MHIMNLYYFALTKKRTTMPSSKLQRLQQTSFCFQPSFKPSLSFLHIFHYFGCLTLDMTIFLKNNLLHAVKHILVQLSIFLGFSTNNKMALKKCWSIKSAPFLLFKFIL